jgi:hypothetical protein
MDDLGLFFPFVPVYSVLFPNEDLSTVRGEKVIQERLSLAICSNADGSQKNSIGDYW